MTRMQREMAEIRAENRLWRTPGVQPVVPTPRQAAFMMTKVPWFGGTTSWEQYQQVFDAIGAAAALPLAGRRTERGIVSADGSSDVEEGSGGRIFGTLWVAGQTGGLQMAV